MTDPLAPPVPARSAILSLLLGAHPPTLTVREIVGAMR
ncbi:MAG TPA: PaaX family transcriptional regulator, partial [Gordonia polyisoprenivorans]|nr:PaaX family transcriptional regulator [Gordonia polyisoprenivorans]